MRTARVIAEPGSVICGTHRPRDLLIKFTTLLADFQPDHPLLPEARRLLAVGERCDEAHEIAMSDFVDEMFDALNEFSPEGHYFGAHEGDGSDFGYWPVDADEDLLDVLP